MPRTFQKRSPGSVVTIDLGDGYHAYGQLLAEPEIAFFNLKTKTIVPVSEAVSSGVAFRAWVHKDAVTTGRWKKLGDAPISAALSKPIPRFIQDPLSPDQFKITLGGATRPASREECVTLERAAVWEPRHIEDRLRDHFAGVPNQWLQSLRIVEAG